MAQLLKIPVKKTCKIKYWYRKRQDLCQENRTQFLDYIKNLSFSESFRATTVNEAFNAFHEMFKMLYELCFPIIRVKLLTHGKPKWISKGIKLCSKNNRKLLWTYRTCPTKGNKRNFKMYNSRYKKIIKLTQKAQNEYYIKQSLSNRKQPGT